MKIVVTFRPVTYLVVFTAPGRPAVIPTLRCRSLSWSVEEQYLQPFP